MVIQNRSVIQLTLDAWLKYLNYDIPALNLIYYLKNQRPYTDDELKESLERIRNLMGKMGLTISDALRIIQGP
jgi:hypothetical protein